MAVHLITGGAGFIGVNLIRALIARSEYVISLDNYCRGRRAHLTEFEGNIDQFQAHEVDCANFDALMAVVGPIHAAQPIEHVWHLAANSDIPAGVADPRIDFRDTFETTFSTLLLMRELRIPQLHFASSSAIYGDLGETEIGEDAGPLEPISNYGAMKLASEAQIRAAVEAYLPRADVFRFPNVVGVPATHGVILDFIQRLRQQPERLDVLGNGTQQKLYLHVEDLIAAMLHIADHARGRYNVFNIGPGDVGATVRGIAEAVQRRVAQGAAIYYGEGDRGWVGDVPRFRYTTARLAALGWTPTLGSLGAVERAVDQIAKQEGQ